MAANIALLPVLAAIIVGIFAPTLSRALLYSGGLSLLVSIGIVIWYGGFFPHEGTAAQMFQALSAPKEDLIALWLMRAALRAALTMAAGAACYGVKRIFKKKPAA